jgi:hypothetical protein
MPIPIGYCIYARAATSLKSWNGDARPPGSSRSRSFFLAQLSAVLVWMSRWTMKVAALSRITTGPPANARACLGRSRSGQSHRGPSRQAGSLGLAHHRHFPSPTLRCGRWSFRPNRRKSWVAGDLLRPSREIEIGPKLGLPKATLRAMEHIDASLDKRQQEVFEMVRSGKKIRLIISMHRLTGVRPIPVGYCVDA